MTFNGPLLPAKPGPTLSGTRIVWALTIPLMLAVSLLLLLLLPKLSSLLLLDFGSAASSQPASALPAALPLWALPLICLLFALALPCALRPLSDHKTLAAVCNNASCQQDPPVCSSRTIRPTDHLLCCQSSLNKHGRHTSMSTSHNGWTCALPKHPARSRCSVI